MFDRGRPPSIRRRLLSFLIPALLLLVACAAVVSYMLALHAATTAYDRSLLDPALDMAENVRLGANGPQLDMLAQEQEALLYDHEDTLVFQIRDAAGDLIAGVSDLAPAPSLEPGQRTFFDATYNGKPVNDPHAGGVAPITLHYINLLLNPRILEDVYAGLRFVWAGRSPEEQEQFRERVSDVASSGDTAGDTQEVPVPSDH